jgi:F-type H+-transporting ATPase subunit delta
MPNPRLASRYAKSLLDLAVERKQLDEVYQDMVFMHRLCADSREFVVLLKSPVVREDKKEKILLALTQGRVSELTALFNQLLIRKGREFYLNEIVDAFIQQYKDYNQIHTVKLTTAMEVSDEIKTELVERLKTSRGLKEVELHCEVNEHIIGGFVLELGDRMIDASVAYELAKIRTRFENNDYMYKIR